jgi:uncharacterized damage-inducible protein DinB
VSEISRIIDELAREHDGDPWHGSPLIQILEGVSAAQAVARPIPGGHSIWELVLHITAWKNEVGRRVGGAPADLPEEGDWPVVGVASEERWREARVRLQKAQARLVAAVRKLTDDQLHEPTNDLRDRSMGSGVSYYVLLHGIVQHDVYHAGQIALLKKAPLNAGR